MVIPIEPINIDGRPVFSNIIAGDPKIKGGSVIRVPKSKLVPLVSGLLSLSRDFDDHIRRSGHPNFGK